MPRAREYRNNAERQAAYRARHRDREPPLQALLAAQARSLHRYRQDAVRSGRSSWPTELLGKREDETMHHQIVHLRAHAQGEVEPSRKEGTAPVR